MKLRIYKAGHKGRPERTVTMERTAADTWTATVTGNLMGRFYTFDTGRGECAGILPRPWV